MFELFLSKKTMMRIGYFAFFFISSLSQAFALTAQDCFDREEEGRHTPHVCFFADPYCNHEEADPVLILTFSAQFSDNLEKCKAVTPEPYVGSIRVLGRCLRATDFLDFEGTRFSTNCRLVGRIASRGLPF